jgi:hypothetical protein
MHVLRPGIHITVGRQDKGPVTLEWVGPYGSRRAEPVVVLKTQRVEIGGGPRAAARGR